MGPNTVGKKGELLGFLCVPSVLLSMFPRNNSLLYLNSNPRGPHNLRDRAVMYSCNLIINVLVLLRMVQPLTPCKTQDGTHPLGRFFKGLLDNDQCVPKTLSDASVQTSRRNLSKATVFVACAPLLSIFEPQSRFGDKPVKFRLVCPQNGTAVLKGLRHVFEETRS